MSRYPHAATVQAVRHIPAQGAYAEGLEVAVEVAKPHALKSLRPGLGRIPVDGFTVPAWLMATGEGVPLSLTLQIRAAKGCPVPVADLEAGLMHSLRSGALQSLRLGGPA